LTDTEEKQLDLPGRMAFVNEASERLLPYLQSLPTYAGAYVVPSESGRLVVLLTGRDGASDAQVGQLAPDDIRSVSIVEAKHSLADLKQAADEAWVKWPGLSSTKLLEVAVDEAENGLTIGVSTMDAAKAQEGASALAERLGVPIALSTVAPELDLSCSSRTSCFTPMKSGIRIDNDVSGGALRCTMGFHVRAGTDVQFLTAGHCGYNAPSDWWHVGYGFIGFVTATQYPSGARDVMRVGMADVQRSNDIYASSWQVTSSRNPLQGESLCASLGVTNAIDCGSVSSAWTSWGSSGCFCTMWGGAYSGIASGAGDSGSPMFALGYSPNAVAIGILDTATKFALVQNALGGLGVTLVTS